MWIWVLYSLQYQKPPYSSSLLLAPPEHLPDQDYYHPHHLDLPPWVSYPSAMQKPQTISPTQVVLSTQDFSKLGFLYITVLGLDNQVVPHTEIWCPWVTAANYLIKIAPIVYMAFQAWPVTPSREQLISFVGCDKPHDYHDVYGQHVASHDTI
ncbi:hypothetical protein DSO57_1031102 [Entomophthora muscae]|uniref:Uncharacterized protein n=1 Tax=Entomophthora muscae TaxID=34485 RepID=A0ACC2RFE4_9FUNG|nr:hypothetical protein DSO57_1031102 [Entomophthora muscae]